MTAPGAASRRDPRLLAGIVSEYREDLPPQGLPLSLLGDLKDLIACEGVSFEGFDTCRERTWLVQEVPEPTDAVAGVPEAVHWMHYWDCEPCSYPDRTGDLRTIVRIADFYSARQWHGTGMYADIYRPQGIEHELMLTLPAGPGKIRGPGRSLRLFFFRERGADFTDTDRALLTLLRPHLQQAYLDAERRRRSAELTPRQWQLMALLAAGHTNAQIARRLGLSEGTVRTHLENVYRVLRVSSRTAAVTRAFPDWDSPASPLLAPAAARATRTRGYSRGVRS